MTSHAISAATVEAIRLNGITPDVIQSNNGSGYVGQEYRSMMSKLNIEHHRIHPHCPNENAEIERFHRTL